MGAIKQSFCYPAFMREGDVTLEQVISAASEIGYSGVEFTDRANVPMDEIMDLVKAHGLVIPSMMGHYSLPDGLNKTANHGRIEEELLESIDIAAKLGIPGLICFSGNREGKSDEEGLENVVAGFDRVKGAAEEKGINLNLELLNSKVNHPDYQCDRTIWGVEVCRRVGSPRVKLLYDIYHMQIMEGDLIRTIQDHGEHFGHYHTAGNPGRNDLDSEQEIQYPAVMRAIVDSGYDLYVGHEFKPKGDPIESLRSAFKVCDI